MLRPPILSLLYTSLVCCLLAATVFSPTVVDAQVKLPRLFNRDNNQTDLDRRLGPATSRTINNRTRPGVNSFLDGQDTRPIPYSIRINALKGYESSFGINSKTSPPGKTVEYVIRKFPTAGKLVGILSNPRNRSSATVTYYADPDSAATLDSFTFVARYPGGKFSEPATCQIQIKDARPIIEVNSPIVDFGDVIIGETLVKDVHITNSGNAPYISKIDLFAPWKIVNPQGGQIALPAESRTIIKVAFTPTIAGPASYHLPFGSSDKATCKLSGVAVPPFSFKKDTWEMTINPQTRDREAKVVVENNLSKPIEVFLRSSNRLKIEGNRARMLLPDKEQVVLVKLPADDYLPIDGGLELKIRDGYSGITKITAKTAPGQLAIEIPNQLGQDVINFGRVKAGRSIEKNIVLKNLGGELLAIDGAVEEPFRLLTRIDRQLGPRESLPITIGYYPDIKDQGGFDQYAVFAARDHQVKLRLLGNAIKADIPAKTELASSIGNTATPTEAASNPAPDTQTTPSNQVPLSTATTTQDQTAPSTLELTPSADEINTPPEVIRNIVDDLYSPEDLFLIKAKPKSVAISWTAPRDADVATFEIEKRSPQTANRSWTPHSSIELKRIERLVKANITELDPKTGYEFRVYTVDSQGRSSPPSSIIKSDTPSDKKWLYIGLLVLLLGLLVMAWVYFKFIRLSSPKELVSEYLSR